MIRARRVAARAAAGIAIACPTVAMAAENYDGLAQALVLLIAWAALLAGVALVAAVVALRQRRWRPMLFPLLFFVCGAVSFWLAVAGEALWPEAITRSLLWLGLAVPTLAAGIAWLLYRDLAAPSD